MPLKVSSKLSDQDQVSDGVIDALKKVLLFSFRHAAFLVIALVYLGAHIPLLDRSTGNAQELAAYVNDEPALTMALDAMTVRPYGNPGNFFLNESGKHIAPGSEWGSIRYQGFTYYGGTYLDLALAGYFPLKLIGVDTFPAAPLLLRLVSALAGLASLGILYSFGRRHFGVWAGVIGATFLLLDPYFFYYSSIIHPDTVQLALGLLLLTLAVNFSNRAKPNSVFWMGLLLGFLHGAKAGGPWAAPVALMAIWLATEPSSSIKTRLKVFAGASARLGFFSLVGFFISTPYAFFDSYYAYSMRVALNLVTEGPIGTVTWLDWLEKLHVHLGNFPTAIIGAGFVLSLTQILQPRKNKALALACILIGAQVSWFFVMGRLWVQLGYLMLAYALAITVFSGRLLCFIRKKISRPYLSQTASAIAILIIGAQLVLNFPTLARSVFHELQRRNSTQAELNNWAKSAISSEAKFLADDSVYFDPLFFKQTKVKGGIILWTDIWNFQPDYLILSSSLFDAAWYREMMDHRTWLRSDTNPYSLRLYQDLAKQSETGKTKIPGIKLVNIFKPGPRETLANPPTTLERLLGFILGESVEYSKGPTLLVFEFSPETGPHAREHAFSSGSASGYRDFFAFDGTTNAWVSSNRGKSAKGDFIGFDYGEGGHLATNEVYVKWVYGLATPKSIAIQLADNGRDWKTVGEFSVTYAQESPNFREDRFALSQTYNGRYWRIVANDVPDDHTFAVAEITFSKSF